jgi:hypothetical protein
MPRKLSLNFDQKKANIPFFSCLKRPYLQNRLSVRAEIMHGVPIKLVLLLDVKQISSKMLKTLSLNFDQKNGKYIPF